MYWPAQSLPKTPKFMPIPAKVYAYSSHAAVLLGHPEAAAILMVGTGSIQRSHDLLESPAFRGEERYAV